METGIHIGSRTDKESISVAADAIIAIIQAGAEQETTRVALRTLSELASQGDVMNTSVNNSTIYGSYMPPNYNMTEPPTTPYPGDTELADNYDY